MTAPSAKIKLIHIARYSCPQRIEMNVTNQFQKIRLFFAHNRLVAILKEMAGPPVPKIESDGIPGEETTHEKGERSMARPQQQM
jgi:hypothetical protein